MARRAPPGAFSARAEPVERPSHAVSSLAAFARARAETPAGRNDTKSAPCRDRGQSDQPRAWRCHPDRLSGPGGTPRRAGQHLRGIAYSAGCCRLAPACDDPQQGAVGGRSSSPHCARARFPTAPGSYLSPGSMVVSRLPMGVDLAAFVSDVTASRNTARMRCVFAA